MCIRDRYDGKPFDDIRLVVKDGVIVDCKSNNQIALENILNTDEGSRRFGEFAIGTNPHIEKPMYDILFDEKIGGSIHMAIGQSYLQAGGKNESTVHWDMISDMQDGGEIIADGELIYKNGRFLI